MGLAEGGGELVGDGGELVGDGGGLDGGGGGGLDAPGAAVVVGRERERGS